jgi:CobQ-like glutamine amidotransferase family enzyme
VSTNISLSTLFPQHLNLNGDQANLLVLQSRASSYGFACRITPVYDSGFDGDLLFIGHGSLAAWADIESKHPTLLSEIAEIVRTGKMVLAVGSGYVKVAQALGLETTFGKHRSEFIEDSGIVGYINSDSELEPVRYESNSLFTLLHGPVLAKNPQLADYLLEKIGVNTSNKSDLLIELDKLAADSRRTAFEH